MPFGEGRKSQILPSEKGKINSKSIVMNALLTYAYDANHQLVHVDTVERGSACACFCPRCNAPLDAKNGGKIREHHFAHAHGHICEGAYETAVHLLAKQIIKEHGGIMLPKSEDMNKPLGFVKLHNVEVEKWDDKFKIRPDVEGLMDDGTRLLIECLVTHKVAEKKYNTILENNLLCLEVDLNMLELDKEVIRDFLTKDSGYRKWVVKREEKDSTDRIGSYYQRNPKFDKVKQILKEIFDNDALIIKDDNNSYNLKKIGYDKCETNSDFRGFKTDLLIYRSNNPKERKGHIAINIRGRRRNQDARIPNDLRVIDVILRDETDAQIQSRFSNGILSISAPGIEFLGEWKCLKEREKHKNRNLNIDMLDISSIREKDPLRPYSRWRTDKF